jgi:hypothetical protein
MRVQSASAPRPGICPQQTIQQFQKPQFFSPQKTTTFIMKNKSRLSGLISCALTALTIGASFINVSAQQRYPKSCEVQRLDISTGVNHAVSALYPYSTAATTVRDNYWNVTCAPTNACSIAPTFCAFLVDQGNADTWDANGGTTANSHWISFTPDPTPAACSDFFWLSSWVGGANGGYAPVPGAIPIRFTRDFFLNAPGLVHINLNTSYADDIANIAVDAVPCAPITGTSPRLVFSDPMTSSTPGASIPGLTVPMLLAAGPHTLDVDLYDISGTLTGINISGFISVPPGSPAVLVDNSCYGKHDCSKPCYNPDSSSLDIPVGSASSPCSFNAHAHITTANTILGYTWTVAPSGGPVTHTTSAPDDYLPFTVAPGTVATVTVTAHILDENLQCCEAVFTQTVTCQDCGCFDSAAITSIMTPIGNDCEYKLQAEAFLTKECQMAAFEWIIGSGPSAFTYTSATTDYMTITVPYGTTQTVTVIFHAFGPNGECTYTKTIHVHCGDIGPGGHEGGQPGKQRKNVAEPTGKLTQYHERIRHRDLS